MTPTHNAVHVIARRIINEVNCPELRVLRRDDIKLATFNNANVNFDRQTKNYLLLLQHEFY